MQCVSTGSSRESVPFAEAVARGLASDGGLYLPSELLPLSKTQIDELRELSFPDFAAAVAEHYLGEELTHKTLATICDASYRFPVPLVPCGEQLSFLELFHGPSCSFKDFGARFMGNLMPLIRLGNPRKLVVLVATSGDTGSAVATGFYKKHNTEVVVLYPKGKITSLQRRQMTTLSANVSTFAVHGTFDDCQALVKQAFLDSDLLSDVSLASGNSISIGRLLPQSFYFAYAALKRSTHGEPVDVIIPSGNLGNATGAILAKRLGFPIGLVVLACNINDRITPLYQSGVFEPQASQETLSNAMDVGNPSNLARLFKLFNDDLTAMQAEAPAETVTDEETIAAIQTLDRDFGYLACPHTAVAFHAYQRRATKRTVPVIIAATAHPAKFSETIEKALGRKPELSAQLVAVLTAPELVKEMANSYSILREVLLARAV